MELRRLRRPCDEVGREESGERLGLRLEEREVEMPDDDNVDDIWRWLRFRDTGVGVVSLVEPLGESLVRLLAFGTSQMSSKPLSVRSCLVREDSFWDIAWRPIVDVRVVESSICGAAMPWSVPDMTV